MILRDNYHYICKNLFVYSLKRIVTYLLIFVVSVFYNIETIKYLLKEIGDSSVCCMDDFQCEENDSEESESEKSDDEKKLLLDNYFPDNQRFEFYVADNKKTGFSYQKGITSFDYCKEIYSPPEL